MTRDLLLPHKYRIIGWCILPFAMAWAIATYWLDTSVFNFLTYKSPHESSSDPLGGSGFLFNRGFSADFNGEIAILLTLLSLFLIAFSREKQEDEYIRSVRLKALQLSVYANYAILALASIFFYGFSFLAIMQANLFTIIVFFIIVYNYLLRSGAKIRGGEPA